ncbi:MAG: DUF6220 domain-containing protein [Gaiellales bacterium]
MAYRIHSGLVHLFGALLVIQFFLAGLGAFTTVHNEKFSDSNFDAHAGLGSLLVIVALVILLVTVILRRQRAIQLAAALFGLMIVQFLLGVGGADTAAWIGGLHGVNALAILAVTGMLIRDAHAMQPASL